jgi:hypothetical protein
VAMMSGCTPRFRSVLARANHLPATVADTEDPQSGFMEPITSISLRGSELRGGTCAGVVRRARPNATLAITCRIADALNRS